MEEKNYWEYHQLSYIKPMLRKRFAVAKISVMGKHRTGYLGICNY